VDLAGLATESGLPVWEWLHLLGRQGDAGKPINRMDLFTHYDMSLRVRVYVCMTGFSHIAAFPTCVPFPGLFDSAGFTPNHPSRDGLTLAGVLSVVCL
jgi:hypothetical protein